MILYLPCNASIESRQHSLYNPRVFTQTKITLKNKEAFGKLNGSGIFLLHPCLLVFFSLCASTLTLSLAACLWDLIAGKSTLLGCLIFALPTLYFSHYAFRYRAGEDCASVARSFYWGQASKISLITIGFALVFVFIEPLNTYALFLGFCLMIPAHVVCATFVSKSLAGTCR